MKRLLDDADAPDLAELLRSAELDVPAAPEERQDRIIAAVVAAPTVTALPVVAAASRLDVLLRGAKWGAPLLGIALTAVLATSTGSSVDPAVARTSARTAEVSPGPSVHEPLTATAAIAAIATIEQAVRVEDLPSARAEDKAVGPSRIEGVAARATAQAIGTAAPTPTPASSIDVELGVIDAARGSLSAGRPAETLARVDGYRSAFSSPQFADEADALEVQALAALGRIDEARSKAEVFLAARGQSPAARRVRSSVGIKE